MKISAFEIIFEMFFVVSLAKTEHLYTDEELEIIRTIGTSMGVACYTFLQNHQDAEVLRKISILPKSQLFSAVANSDEFDAILNGGFRRKYFFKEKTALITKENFNFTNMIEKLSGVRSVIWLVFVKSLTDIRDYYIPINANFFAVYYESDKVIISKVNYAKPGWVFTVKTIGVWAKGKNKKQLFSEDKKINLNNIKLNLLFYSTEEECNRKMMRHVLDRMECFHQEMVKIFAEMLNFTINKIKCKERQYPYNYANGTPSEMFLLLTNKEVDISSGSYIISKSRLTLYDFAWSTFTTKSMMYIKFRNIRNNWRAYLRPIESDVWMATFSLVLVIGLLVQFFEVCRLKNFKFKLSFILKFIHSVLLSLQMFCSQGIHNISEWCSSRIVFLTTFLLFVSLYQAYSGFLISFLTVAIPDIPFTDIKGFFRDGTYKIMTLRKGFHNYFLKKIFKEHKKAVKSFMLKQSELPFTAFSGIRQLCSRKRITYLEFRENIVQHRIPCKITELPKPIFYQSLGIGFPKNSTYQEIIHRKLNLLRSTGVLHRMKRNLLSYVELEQKEISEDRHKKVSLSHVISLFFILGTGTLMSVIVFLLEILWNFLERRKSSYRRNHIKVLK